MELCQQRSKVQPHKLNVIIMSVGSKEPLWTGSPSEKGRVQLQHQ